MVHLSPVELPAVAASRDRRSSFAFTAMAPPWLPISLPSRLQRLGCHQSRCGSFSWSSRAVWSCLVPAAARMLQWPRSCQNRRHTCAIAGPVCCHSGTGQRVFRWSLDFDGMALKDVPFRESMAVQLCAPPGASQFPPHANGVKLGPALVLVVEQGLLSQFASGIAQQTRASDQRLFAKLFCGSADAFYRPACFARMPRFSPL